MGIRWADYSGGYPGAASLAAAGFSGAIRYIGKGTAGKRLTAAERQDFDAHGFAYLLVCELDTHDAEGGYAAGRSFAQVALADARANGVPDSVGIACAADEHLTTAQIPGAVEYARGFRDVVGQSRHGAYGFSEFLAAVHAAGLASWYWQSGSPPSVTETDGYVHFWQRNTGQTTSSVNGVTCDISDQLLPLPAQPTRGSNEDMWKFLADVGTADGSGGFTRCAELRPDSTLIGCDWPDVKAKTAENGGGNASVRGVSTAQFDDYVTNSDAVKASVAALIGLTAAVARVGTFVLTTDQVASITEAVELALKTLSLSVSPADQTSIANTVVATLAAKLSAPKAA